MFHYPSPVVSSRKWLVAALLVCAPIACGGAGSVKLVPASGTVTLSGQPVAEGTIRFDPDVAKGNTAPLPGIGDIVDGKYTLKTGGKDGVPVGDYKVAVIVNAPNKSKDEYAVPRSLIAPKFALSNESHLTATVKDGGGPYDFTVTK